MSFFRHNQQEDIYTFVLKAPVYTYTVLGQETDFSCSMLRSTKPPLEGLLG